MFIVDNADCEWKPETVEDVWSCMSDINCDCQLVDVNCPADT